MQLVFVFTIVKQVVFSPCLSLWPSS